MKRTVLTVLGTRPEIVKFSPVLPLFDEQFRHVLVHTGQHYDENMDRVFFRELRLKLPKYFLNVGAPGVGQGAQIGHMLEKLEPVVQRVQPDWVVVLGDTNTTLAGALAAAKMNFRIAHIEAGCRSFNRRAPEEQNRVLVDHLADLLLAPDKRAVENLHREGLERKRIRLVGSTGSDATRRALDFITTQSLSLHGLKPDTYVLVTIHRAENTNDAGCLSRLVEAINEISNEVLVVFPVHPRTAAAMKRNGLKFAPGVKKLQPIGNLDFLALLKHAIFAMTDSGGVQEDAVVLNRPCLILRDETEWTRFTEAGKTLLVGSNVQGIVRAARRLLRSPQLRLQIQRRRSPLRFGSMEKIVRLLRDFETDERPKRIPR